MAIRMNSQGTEWAVEHPTFQDMNDTNDYLEENAQAVLGAVAEANYKTLKAAGSFEISDGAYAERYTDSNGVNNSVDTTNSTATFSVGNNKYWCGNIANYKFSNNVNDSSGNAYTLVNTAVTFGTDKNAAATSAAVFNGTTAWLAITNPLLSGQNKPNYSISFWIQHTNTTGVQTYVATNTDTNFVISQNATALSVNAGGVTMSGWSPALPTMNTSWRHIVLTFSGTGTNRVKLYIDGTVYNSTSADAITALTTINTLRLGTSSASSNWYNGKMDEVQVFNRTLTQTEVTTLYSSYDSIATNFFGNCNVIHNTGLLLDNTESVASIYANTQGSLIYSGTGDGSNDTQSFVKTASYNSTDNIKGIKITAKNNIELKQVKFQALDSALTGSVLKIYNNAKSLLKTISTTNTFTTGTADGTDDSSTISSTWSTSAGQTGLYGMSVKIINNCFLKSVTKEASCTATKAYLVCNNRIIASQAFSGNVATFGTLTGQFMEQGNVYTILCGSDGSSYTARQGATTTATLNADLLIYGGTADTNGGNATYVNTTTTNSIAFTGNHFNVASFITQTASTPSTRMITSGIDFTLEAGKSYYLVENASAYTNFFPSAYSQTFPDTSEADVNLVGGATTGSISDLTTHYGGITELITQNITGSLTQVTGIKVNCSDGTTTTSDVQVDSKGKAIVDISSLSGGSLKVTAKLETTDTSLTPEIYGLSCVIR